MTTKIKKKLASANKPWQLIRDAVEDLTAQEKFKCVKINMATWHDVYNNKCYQCFAGCVISARLNIPHTESSAPESFDEDITNKLRALDYFRVGNIELAYQMLGLGTEFENNMLPDSMEVESYCNNKRKFKQDMLRLADNLETTHSIKW